MLKNIGKVYQSCNINVVDFKIKDVNIVIAKFQTLTYRNQIAYTNHMHKIVQFWRFA